MGMDAVTVRAGRAAATSQSIIDGALSVMVEDGLAALTTKSVSRRADVSTAAIHYFFQTKDNLVYSAFVFVIRSTRCALLDVRRVESDPAMRLRRSIEVFFQSDPGEARIWPQLWVYADNDTKTQRLFRIYNARLISNFTYDLRQLGVERARARRLAVKLNALHRGLWIEQQIGASITARECEGILDMVLEGIDRS